MRATTLALLLLPMMAAADTFNGPYPYMANGIGYAYNEDPSNYSEGIQVYFSAPVSYYEFSVSFARGVINPQVSDFVQCSTCTPTVTWIELPPYSPYGLMATVSGTAPNVTQMNVTVSIDRSTPVYVGPLGFVPFTITNLNNPSSTGITQVGDAPEPATLSLAGLALIAMVVGRRRWIAERPALIRGS